MSLLFVGWVRGHHYTELGVHHYHHIISQLPRHKSYCFKNAATRCLQYVNTFLMTPSQPHQSQVRVIQSAYSHLTTTLSSSMEFYSKYLWLNSVVASRIWNTHASGLNYKFEKTFWMWEVTLFIMQQMANVETVERTLSDQFLGHSLDTSISGWYKY